MHPRDDSIDSLLDDLATETSNAYKKLPSLRSAKRISSSNDLKQDHSVDELLKELELDLNAVAPSSDRQNVSVEVTLRAAQNSEMLSAGSPAASPAKRKCSPVCIGGTQDEVGITAATPTTAARFWRTCDMIRCLSCDFRCLKFPNAMWTTRVDYMFFRNYVPDERKLASGLERKDGYQAYCCQCSWVSVNALARVNALPNCDKFKWVCGARPTASNPLADPMDLSVASVASSTGSANIGVGAGGTRTAASKEEQIVQNFYSKVAQVIVQSRIGAPISASTASAVPTVSTASIPSSGGLASHASPYNTGLGGDGAPPYGGRIETGFEQSRRRSMLSDPALMVGSPARTASPSFNVNSPTLATGLPLPGQKASGTKSNKWFNLELPEIEPLKSEMKHWRAMVVSPTPSAPLIIDIFLDITDVSPTQVLILKDEVTLRRQRIGPEHLQSLDTANGTLVKKRRVLLETWQLTLSPSGGSSAPEAAVLYKKSIMFFRSLFSYCRLLPAFRLHKKLKRQKGAALKIGYRLSTQRFMPVDEAGLDQLHSSGDMRRGISEYSFGSVDSGLGTFNLHVTYRLECEFTVDDTEAILSSRFVDMDDNYFAPRSFESTRLLSQRNSLRSARTSISSAVRDSAFLKTAVGNSLREGSGGMPSPQSPAGAPELLTGRSIGGQATSPRSRAPKIPLASSPRRDYLAQSPRAGQLDENTTSVLSKRYSSTGLSSAGYGPAFVSESGSHSTRLSSSPVGPAVAAVRTLEETPPFSAVRMEDSRTGQPSDMSKVDPLLLESAFADVLESKGPFSRKDTSEALFNFGLESPPFDISMKGGSSMEEYSRSVSSVNSTGSNQSALQKPNPRRASYTFPISSPASGTSLPNQPSPLNSLSGAIVSTSFHPSVTPPAGPLLFTPSSSHIFMLNNPFLFSSHKLSPPPLVTMSSIDHRSPIGSTPSVSPSLAGQAVTSELGDFMKMVDSKRRTLHLRTTATNLPPAVATGNLSEVPEKLPRQPRSKTSVLSKFQQIKELNASFSDSLNIAAATSKSSQGSKLDFPPIVTLATEPASALSHTALDENGNGKGRNSGGDDTLERDEVLQRPPLLGSSPQVNRDSSRLRSGRLQSPNTYSAEPIRISSGFFPAAGNSSPEEKTESGDSPPSSSGAIGTQASVASSLSSSIRSHGAKIGAAPSLEGVLNTSSAASASNSSVTAGPPNLPGPFYSISTSPLRRIPPPTLGAGYVGRHTFTFGPRRRTNSSSSDGTALVGVVDGEAVGILSSTEPAPADSPEARQQAAFHSSLASRRRRASSGSAVTQFAVQNPAGTMGLPPLASGGPAASRGHGTIAVPSESIGFSGGQPTGTLRSASSGQSLRALMSAGVAPFGNPAISGEVFPDDGETDDVDEGSDIDDEDHARYSHTPGAYDGYAESGALFWSHGEAGRVGEGADAGERRASGVSIGVRARRGERPSAADSDDLFFDMSVDIK